MAREFTISAGGQTVGANTLIWLNPTAAPNSNIEILRLWVAQSANATSAQVRVQVVTQVTAFPTLAAGATPRPHKHADATASIITPNTNGSAGTAGFNASAEGAGAKIVKIDDSFNVLNGWLWIPTPRETIVMPAGSLSGIGLFLPVAPTSTGGWSFGMTFAEV